MRRQRPEWETKRGLSKAEDVGAAEPEATSRPADSNDSAVAIIAVPAGDPLVGEIIGLADRARDTLGFLPREVFRKAARSGTLLAAMRGKRLCGYALFGLPGQYIRLTHLCIAPEFQQLGFARRLVGEISSRHPDRLGIILRCRRDYPAHRMWPALGFEPRNERRGRGAEPTELVVWWLDHGHPDLFSVAEQQAVLRVSLGYDGLVQLHTPRWESASEFEALRQDWIADQLQLVVVAEIYQRINRLTDSVERRRLRGAVSGYPQPKQDPGRTTELADQIVRCMPEAGQVDPSEDSGRRSEARLVAQTALAGISVLVTCDEQMISRMSSTALQVCGVQIMQPTDVVLHLDELIRRQEYQPAELLDTEYTVTTVGPGREDELRRVFLDRLGREAEGVFSTRLRELAAAAPVWTRKVVRDPSGQAVALYAYGEQHGEVVVPVLRVNSSELGETITRQMLLVLRRACRGLGLSRISLTDPNLSDAVRSAALEDGYQPNRGRLTAMVVDACADAVTISSGLQAVSGEVDFRIPEISANPPAALAVALERALWPAKFTDADLPTFVVPIRPTWSSLLFGVPRSLFRRSATLGINREHVYYRSPRPRVEKAPARILWYASGAGKEPGVGAIVAYSRLEEVVADQPGVLYQRFRHLGVWHLHQIEQVARDDQALALRFFDSEVFNRPVGLRRLRELAAQHHVQLALRSPQRIPPQLFSALYLEATAQH